MPLQRAGDSRKLLLPALTLAVLVAALGLLLLFHPAPAPANDSAGMLTLSGPTMGTRYRVLVPSVALGPRQRQTLANGITTHLARLDRQLLSTYAPDSQLSRLNRQAPGQPMLVAAELLTVLDAAARVWAQSGGAFDITVKPLVDLWGFGPGFSTGHIPDNEAIDRARGETGMDRFAVDSGAGTVLKRAPVTLDLSAIAKGYAVDELARLLEADGIRNYLVEIGGELRINGSRPGGEPWQVGIETPVAAQPTLFQALATGNRDLAIATSGNYRNYFMVDGVRYSHTIDPQTGRPVTHNLASVTVVADSAMLADAWATAMAVLGVEAGMKLANELQLAVYFIVESAGSFSALHSAAFNRYLVLL